MITLDKDKALALLEQVVSEKGADYKCERVNTEGGKLLGDCAYTTKDGAPSCIVGHVVAKAGGNLSAVRNYEWFWDEETGADHFAGSMSANVLLSPEMTNRIEGLDVIAADRRTVNVLLAAQDKQDSGGTWGEALDAARQNAELYA